MSRDVLARIENGIRTVTDSEIVFLASCLRVSVEALFPPRAQAVKLALARLDA